MTPATRSEVDEVVSQWLLYARRIAGAFPEAEETDLGGVAVCWLNVDWPVMNLSLVNTAVEDEADLERRARAAVRHAHGRKFVFATCDELLPEPLRFEPAAVLARSGFRERSAGGGMLADAIAPEARPMPRLEYRTGGDAETRRDIADLNAVVYGLPTEWTREVLRPEGLFDDGVFGCVAYLDGCPVGCAMTCIIEDRMHVAWVATHPEQQGRGYGEAVTRESLRRVAAASGLKRSVLRATKAGHRLYTRMGYRRVAVFRYWSAEC